MQFWDQICLITHSTKNFKIIFAKIGDKNLYQKVNFEYLAKGNYSWLIWANPSIYLPYGGVYLLFGALVREVAKFFVIVARNIRALPLHAISGPLKFFCKTTLVTRGSTRRIRAARTFIWRYPFILYTNTYFILCTLFSN